MDGSSASPRLMSSSPNAQTLQKDTQPNLQRKRRPKMTLDEKVDQVFHLLRNELHWSLIDFFRALYSNPQHYRRRLAFEEAAYRTPDLLKCVLAPSPTSNNTRLALLDALSWGSAELRTEVLELGQTSLFGKYSSESNWAEINEESLSNLMQVTAPATLRVLQDISRPIDAKNKQEYSQRLVTVLAILCFLQRPYSCTNIPTTLGLHLFSKGVKTHEIDILAKCGITVSYKTVMRVMKSLSDQQEDAVALEGALEGAVTCYDNFEQVEGIKEQRIEDNSTFNSVTTGELIQGADIPPGGLQQDMLNLTVRLNIDNALFTQGNSDDEMECEISRYFAAHAIREAFPEVVDNIFASSKELFPLMPKLNVLQPRKTIHRPLGPIPHDESSNAGNLAVLENIFRGQYRLPDEAFNSTLHLIYGDQKTTQRIRTIKRRRRRAAQPFDRLNWALPVPAFFHLKMNFLYMLSRAHFGGADQDQSTLYDAMNFWRRKKISKAKADFFALEELSIHSFQARVVALMWHKLSRTGLGKRAEDIEAMLRNLTPSLFLDLVDKVWKQYSFTTNRNLDIFKDAEVRNHFLFLQQAQTYMLLKYAIKNGDIGLIRRTIDRCCVYFHGSGQHKYAYEMLYIQRLFLASKPPLSQAILSNSLVNLQGHPNTWFETDRLVELHNGNMKSIFNAKRGSSIDLNHLFKIYSLNSAYLAKLNSEVERVFGTKSNSDHTLKSAGKDIRLMAERLSTSSIIYTEGRSVKYRALDVLAIGARRLAGDTLFKFNANECLEDDLDDSLLEEEGKDQVVEQFFNHLDLE